MGSRKSDKPTQTEVKQHNRCNICNRVPQDSCDWRQGRCPHVLGMLDCIMTSPYKTRFYNLLKLITGKK
jgi:hypothetical protein